MTELIGDQKLDAVKLSQPYKDSEILKLDGLFIEIGSVPERKLPEQIGITTTKAGYIEVNPDQSTNVPGVFAAGDITTASNNFHQVITAAAEGGIAAESIFRYLNQNSS